MLQLLFWPELIGINNASSLFTPYPFRSVPAPYLWCYYRLLCEWATESCMFITGRDYVRPIEQWKTAGSAQMMLQQDLTTLPKNTQPPQHHYAWLDKRRFDEWFEHS